MNRKLTIATIAGLLAITGCTSQQRAMLDSAQESEPPPTTEVLVSEGLVAESQSLTVEVDCSEVTARLSGYPEGAVVRLALRPVVGDEAAMEFTTHAGGDAGVLSVPVWEDGQTFTATIDIDGVSVFEQHMAC